MATRIAACWRRGELYVLRDVDGSEITEDRGRAICAERYKVTAEVRAARKRERTAQQRKKREGPDGKESTKAAPASDPPSSKAIPVAAPPDQRIRVSWLETLDASWELSRPRIRQPVAGTASGA